MTDIPRWYIGTNRLGAGSFFQTPNGGWVAYTDHVADATTAWAEGYEQGQRDALAGKQFLVAEARQQAIADAVTAVEGLAQRRGGSDGSPAQMLYDNDVIATIKAVGGE
jgi:hypothetical protein